MERSEPKKMSSSNFAKCLLYLPKMTKKFFRLRRTQIKSQIFPNLAVNFFKIFLFFYQKDVICLHNSKKLLISSRICSKNAKKTQKIFFAFGKFSVFFKTSFFNFVFFKPFNRLNDCSRLDL